MDSRRSHNKCDHTHLACFSVQSSLVSKRLTKNLANSSQYASEKVEITSAMVERTIQKRRLYFEEEESDKAPEIRRLKSLSEDIKGWSAYR